MVGLQSAALLKAEESAAWAACCGPSLTAGTLGQRCARGGHMQKALPLLYPVFRAATIQSSIRRDTQLHDRSLSSVIIAGDGWGQEAQDGGGPRGDTGVGWGGAWRGGGRGGDVEKKRKGHRRRRPM